MRLKLLHKIIPSRPAKNPLLKGIPLEFIFEKGKEIETKWSGIRMDEDGRAYLILRSWRSLSLKEQQKWRPK